MKIRLLLSLVGLAVGFAFPTLAQEQNTVDPEIRQQIEAAFLKYEEAYYEYDAAAFAACYTQDAVEVLPETGGAAVGQQAIEKRYAVMFASQPEPSSQLSLLTGMQSATTYVRSRISVIIPFERDII